MNRVQKLESLLARVRERREAPRLRTVSPALAPAQPSNQAVDRAPAMPITERFSRPVPATPLEDAMSELAPTPMARTPTPAAPRTPVPSGELSLDDFELARPAPAPAPARAPAPAPAAEKKRVEPPAAKAPPPDDDDLFGDPFASRPPPAAPIPVATPASPVPVPMPAPVAAPVPQPVAMPTPAPQPVQLGAPSARIAADPAAASAPVARAVSPVRTEAPNTFGELLERTLSLRPR